MRITGRSLIPLLLCLTAGYLSSCSAPLPPPIPTSTRPAPLSTATAAPDNPAPSPTNAPAPSATPDLAGLPAPRYTLSVVYNYQAHTAAVLEQIVYANRGSGDIPELLLVADIQTYPGALTLKSLSTSAGPAVTGTTWEKTWLHAALERPLKPGESLTLEASFDLALPRRTADPGLRPMVFGWSESQVNLVDWYLYLPPYIPGQGWLAHPPGYYGEHQVYEEADFTVNVQVSGAPSRLVTAAPAPVQPSGEWQRYDLEQARTFALSFSPDYQTDEQTVDGVTLTGYYWSYHSQAGQAALQSAAQALQLYARLFGPYPHKSLAVVEADFLDGMEYDGLFFLSKGFYNLYDGTPGSYLVALAAHETSHQWWFGLVGDDQALEPWLDEALATYCERLYFETYAPKALDWWWQVRVLYYQPHGYVDDSIYNPHKEAQAYRAYRDAVYLNGALFLEDLRKQIGDEAFFAFLKDYATTYRAKIATGSDFFNLLAKHTSADLGPLKKKYFAAAP
jgi:hypothetical protein